MRSAATFLLLLVACCAICPATARGDGGVVRLVEEQNGLRISVFTSPNPLRAGPADVSVLVQDAQTSALVLQAKVMLKLTCRSAPEVARQVEATSGAATNKLLRAALVELSQPGWWDVEVECDAADQMARTRFEMEVQPPLPEWLTVWPWFSWPFAAVVVFGVHRWLLGRRLIDRQHAATMPAVGSDKRSGAPSGLR